MSWSPSGRQQNKSYECDLTTVALRASAGLSGLPYDSGVQAHRGAPTKVSRLDSTHGAVSRMDDFLAMP
eukprot:5643951-Pleurochrysis_carterae.AAC.1